MTAFNFSKFNALSFSAIVALISACTPTESHRSIAPQKVATYNTQYNGVKHVLVVGRFQNRSSYMQGIFASETDRLGNQSKTILKTHLQQTNRFSVVDRENMERIQEEAKFSGIKQQLRGARFAVTGDVTEFGRKTVGDQALFGIAGRGKTQVAYAKVSLNIVDVRTSEIIYSTQGAGEYALSNREVIGFGSTSGYDSTLNGKVLNFAITEAVNNLVEGLQNGAWSIN